VTAISNAQRAALRRAIAASPDWPAYRRTHGVDTASLGSARAVDVARHLGLDVEAIIGGAAPAEQENPDMNAIPAPAAPAGLFDKRTPVAPAIAAPAVPAGDVGAALAVLAGAFGGAGNVQPALDALGARIAALESAAPRLLVIDTEGRALGDELPETRHPMLETLVRLLAARDAAGRRLNVWITGPTGSGKTHGAKQAASALGLAWGFHGAMSMAHELVGFVDAGGKYHETVFVDRFRNGGLCLLDELDSWSAEATLCLNAALANGEVSLPTGEIVPRHADFACVGAGNTWGAGATAEFVGRNRLDAAFLSRFAAKLAWGYDEKLESAICGNPAWAAQVQRARKKAAAQGLKVIIDPRVSMAGAAMIAAGFTAQEAASMTYLAGLTDAQAAMLAGV
jgi:hypothetical protein